MAIKVSTGLRKMMLDSSSLRAALNNGFIKIYSGTVPSSADSSIGSATLLCTISINSTGSGLVFETSAVDDTISKNSDPWSGVNVASGTATFYRHVTSSDTGTLSTVEPRIQGTCGVSGTDLILASASFTSGQTTVIDSYSITFPSG